MASVVTHQWSLIVVTLPAWMYKLAPPTQYLAKHSTTGEMTQSKLFSAVPCLKAAATVAAAAASLM